MKEEHIFRLDSNSEEFRHMLSVCKNCLPKQISQSIDCDILISNATSCAAKIASMFIDKDKLHDIMAGMMEQLTTKIAIEPDESTSVVELCLSSVWFVLRLQNNMPVEQQLGVVASALDEFDDKPAFAQYKAFVGRPSPLPDIDESKASPIARIQQAAKDIKEIETAVAKMERAHTRELEQKDKKIADLEGKVQDLKNQLAEQKKVRSFEDIIRSYLNKNSKKSQHIREEVCERVNMIISATRAQISDELQATLDSYDDEQPTEPQTVVKVEKGGININQVDNLNTDRQ